MEQKVNKNELNEAETAMLFEARRLDSLSDEIRQETERRILRVVESIWLEIEAIRQVSHEMERLIEEGALPENWREDVCWQ